MFLSAGDAASFQQEDEVNFHDPKILFEIEAESSYSLHGEGEPV